MLYLVRSFLVAITLVHLNLNALEVESDMATPPPSPRKFNPSLADMVFVLNTPVGDKRFEFESRLIDEKTSPFLASVVMSAKSDHGPDDAGLVEVPLLDVDDPAAFREILNFISTGEIDLTICPNLPKLVEYAHRFIIIELGNAIVKPIALNKFALLDKVKQIDWIITLGRAIGIAASGAKEALAKAPKKPAPTPWELALFQELVEYLLVIQMEGDSSGIYNKFKEEFAKDPLFEELFKPHANTISKCTSTMDARSGSIKMEEAQKWADEMAKAIALKFIELVRAKRRNQPMEIIVDASKAKEYYKALKNKLIDFEVTLLSDIGEYELPRAKNVRSNPDFMGFFCMPSFCADPHILTPCTGGNCFAGALGVVLPYFGFQCLQAGTCGYLFCCLTDCASDKSCCTILGDAIYDDRTASAIFYGSYNGCTSLRKCFKKGEFGPTRVIEVKLKKAKS